MFGGCCSRFLQTGCPSYRYIYTYTHVLHWTASAWSSRANLHKRFLTTFQLCECGQQRDHQSPTLSTVSNYEIGGGGGKGFTKLTMTQSTDWKLWRQEHLTREMTNWSKILNTTYVTWKHSGHSNLRRGFLCFILGCLFVDSKYPIPGYGSDRDCHQNLFVVARATPRRPAQPLQKFSLKSVHNFFWVI